MRNYCVVVFLLVLCSRDVFAQRSDAWTEPQDAAMAINQSDEYAWRLFVALNWPADPSKRESDKNKKLGDAGITTWESWRAKQETFLKDAVKPPEWLASGADDKKKLFPAGQFQPLRELIENARKQEKQGITPKFIPPTGVASTAADEEVRLNRTTYEHIRDTGVYSLNKQEELAKTGVKSLQFPVNSKEVKAHWALLTDANDKDRYHWAEFEREGKKEIYGLVGWSITTKDLPRWFWATFEHVDNEKVWPNREIHGKKVEGFAGWIVPSRDTFADPTNPASNKFPTGIGLEATKWQYYRLRGTQTEFVDAKGRPTILVNSKIEGEFEQTSMSCITCHALAAKGPTGRPMPLAILNGLNDQGKPRGFNGAVRPERFVIRENAVGNPLEEYMQLDFVWALRNAQREP